MNYRFWSHYYIVDRTRNINEGRIYFGLFWLYVEIAKLCLMEKWCAMSLNCVSWQEKFSNVHPRPDSALNSDTFLWKEATNITDCKVINNMLHFIIYFIELSSIIFFISYGFNLIQMMLFQFYIHVQGK